MDHSFDLHRERRGLFASDVEAYERGRPGYPERVYDLLREMCRLRPATRVLEIGPGTGQATARLLDLGASVTAVELGADLAARLVEKFGDSDLVVDVGAFEDIDRDDGAFELIVAATSFHWVPTAGGLRRCADQLRPDGWLALWWNSYGDPDRSDPFHEALTPVLEALAPSLLEIPSAGTPGAGATPYALDRAARIAEIESEGRFGRVHHETIAWTGRHSARELRAMFGSFSPWLALPKAERNVVLNALEQLAIEQFNGVVERPYLTPIYLAQRQP
jgi:SAM-dependent methyltransferase